MVARAEPRPKSKTALRTSELAQSAKTRSRALPGPLRCKPASKAGKFWYQGEAWYRHASGAQVWYVSPTRLYQAEDGRFVERDLYGRTGYDYVANRPSSIVDPDGLQPLPVPGDPQYFPGAPTPIGSSTTATGILPQSGGPLSALGESLGDLATTTATNIHTQPYIQPVTDLNDPSKEYTILGKTAPHSEEWIIRPTPGTPAAAGVPDSENWGGTLDTLESTYEIDLISIKFVIDLPSQAVDVATEGQRSFAYVQQHENFNREAYVAAYAAIRRKLKGLKFRCTCGCTDEECRAALKRVIATLQALAVTLAQRFDGAVSAAVDGGAPANTATLTRVTATWAGQARSAIDSAFAAGVTGSQRFATTFLGRRMGVRRCTVESMPR